MGCLKQSKYTPISYYTKFTDKTSTQISFETVFELLPVELLTKAYVVELHELLL